MLPFNKQMMQSICQIRIASLWRHHEHTYINTQLQHTLLIQMMGTFGSFVVVTAVREEIVKMLLHSREILAHNFLAVHRRVFVCASFFEQSWSSWFYWFNDDDDNTTKQHAQVYIANFSITSDSLQPFSLIRTYVRTMCENTIFYIHTRLLCCAMKWMGGEDDAREQRTCSKWAQAHKYISIWARQMHLLCAMRCLCIALGAGWIGGGVKVLYAYLHVKRHCQFNVIFVDFFLSSFKNITFNGGIFRRRFHNFLIYVYR